MSAPHLLKAIFIAEGHPATNDAAGFEALDWERVAHPIVGPSFGTTNNNIDIPNLETGFTAGGKGAQSGNESAMEFGKVAGDEGQELLKELAEAGGVNGNASIKVARITTAGGDPEEGASVEYALGYLGGYSEGAADTASYENINVTFKQNAPAVNAAEPA